MENRMPESIYVHNGKHFKEESEYYESVVQNGDVRSAVTLAAARFFYRETEKLQNRIKELENKKNEF